MPRDPVDLVREVLTAYEHGDLAAAVERLDPSVEFVLLPEMPGATSYRGHDGMGQAMAAWVGSWEEYRFDAVDFAAAGDRVLVTGIESAKGRASGVPVTKDLFSVWSLSAGRVVRVELFSHREQAEKAFGPTRTGP